MDAMNWYREAERELAEVASSVQSQRPFELHRLETLATDLVSSLQRNDELVVEALSGPTGPPLITNLINVGILGARVGIGLGYFGKELGSLALAGLVHDIGLFAVPESLVLKPGRLTRDERSLIERHPELGCRVVERVGTRYHWLAQLIRQAHERYNGQGYPNRLKGRQISEMAQILGVVDVFDALVSERPYRRRLLQHDAVRELLVAERTAFPREILKALVEQLSVYPLGTTVRLTTGEAGTVVRVNPRFPLRPVVHISDRETHGAAEREVDVSLTPLVSIVDVLHPPVVGQVTFSNEPVMAPPSNAPGSASEHFTSLLESLDAIASAIQGVVEARMARTQLVQTSDSPSNSGLDLSGGVEGPHDLTFRKEIIGLFALEAREWLAQIETSIEKLGAGVEGPARSKLYGFILNGITNLAKSAATIQLSEIEDMASNLLPILRGVGEADRWPQLETLRSFRAGLDRIAAAVQGLTEGTFEESVSEKITERRETPTEESAPEPEPAREYLPPPSRTMERVAMKTPLLGALRELHQARVRSVQPARDVLETVIDRAEREAAGKEEQVSTWTIDQILSDLDRLDDEFLQEVRERVPVMTEILGHLREQGSLDFVTASQLAPVLDHVEKLYEKADTIKAVTIAMFLLGLQSFLTAATYRKIEALPHRLQAVEERLQALASMTEQWVTLGRFERASIRDILPT